MTRLRRRLRSRIGPHRGPRRTQERAREAASLLALYGAIDTNSSGQNLLCAPVFVQEMVLAGSMIGRSFRPAAVSATSELAEP